MPPGDPICRSLAEEYDIPFLGQIPLVQGIREGGDAGIPAMVGDDPASRRAFLDFAGNAIRSIAMMNANIGTTRVAEVVA
jgi:ATP-binding protein involved in chromosome partitioning